MNSRMGSGLLALMMVLGMLWSGGTAAAEGDAANLHVIGVVPLPGNPFAIR